MQKYFENLYKILFESDFDGAEEYNSLLIPVVTLFWTASFCFVPSFDFHSNSLQNFISSLFGYLLSVCFFWIVSAWFFSFTAKIFGNVQDIKKLLTLTAYCLLPLMFFAPLEIMKNFSESGYFFGTQFQFLLYVWVIFLYLCALAKTYNLKKSSSFFLILLPFAGFWLSLIWLIGIIMNLGYIYSV